jgi:hypothetical protein
LIASGTVSNITPFVLLYWARQQYNFNYTKNFNWVVSNKGYIVEADFNYVSVRLNAAFSPMNSSYAHAGGVGLKGNSALGKTFRLGAMTNPLFDTSFKFRFHISN